MTGPSVGIVLEAIRKHSRETNDYPEKWYTRTPDFLYYEIIEALANRRSIVGPQHSDKATVGMLIEEAVRNPELKCAIKTLADAILSLFPPSEKPKETDEA